MAIVDFSAQFGGRDAAEVLLPHFKTLKSTARGVTIQGFPFPKLAFILRVDGDISQYGKSGIGNLDVDSKKQYLSVDIVITKKDRDDIQSMIIKGLNESIDLIETAYSQKKIKNFNKDTLTLSINSICTKYASALNINDDD